MIRMMIEAKDVDELQVHICDLFDKLFHRTETKETVNMSAPTIQDIKPDIKPVITQEQMAQNEVTAPKHELPPIPSIEEVRAALSELRDRKGTPAVKELLNDYGVGKVLDLKPEDQLIVLSEQ